MRRSTVATVIVLSTLACSVASAQEAPVTTTTTTSQTSPTSLPVTGTTTTTQATLDVPTTGVVTPTAPVMESGGAETTTYVNRPLLGTGLVMFGGTFLASTIVAAESSRPSDNPNLYYPVVGPWMDFAQMDCSAARPCSNEGGSKALLILDGIGQGVGVLAVLTSFFVPEKKSRHWFFIGNDKVQAAPTVVGTGYGVGAVGRF